MSKHSTCVWCDGMCTSSIIYISLWHSVLISALLCPVSVQISAALFARNPSQGVGSRNTCWAASHLLHYLTIVSIMSQKKPPDSCFFKRLEKSYCCFVCLQRMCSVKTAESAPSVWRIWYRERPSPGWLASASIIRGNKFQLLYLHNKLQTYKWREEDKNTNRCNWD